MFFMKSGRKKSEKLFKVKICCSEYFFLFKNFWYVFILIRLRDALRLFPVFSYFRLFCIYWVKVYEYKFQKKLKWKNQFTSLSILGFRRQNEKLHPYQPIDGVQSILESEQVKQFGLFTLCFMQIKLKEKHAKLLCNKQWKARKFIQHFRPKAFASPTNPFDG